MLETTSYGMYLEQKKENVWWAKYSPRPPEECDWSIQMIRFGGVLNKFFNPDYSFKGVYEALKGQFEEYILPR